MGSSRATTWDLGSVSYLEGTVPDGALSCGVCASPRCTQNCTQNCTELSDTPPVSRRTRGRLAGERPGALGVQKYPGSGE